MIKPIRFSRIGAISCFVCRRVNLALLLQERTGHLGAKPVESHVYNRPVPRSPFYFCLFINKLAIFLNVNRMTLRFPALKNMSLEKNCLVLKFKKEGKHENLHFASKICVDICRITSNQFLPFPYSARYRRRARGRKHS